MLTENINFKEGKKARLKNLKMSDCPHSRDTKEGKAWFAGWQVQNTTEMGA